MSQDQIEQAAAPVAPAEAPGDDRASIIAEMAANRAKPADEEAGEVDLTQTAAPDEAAQDEAEEVEPEEVETETEPEEVEASPADATLEKIQQAEKRSKERLSEHMATERAQLAQEREEHAAAIAEAQTIKADHEAAARRAFDPKGKSPDEVLHEARRLHAIYESTKEGATPAEKAQGQRTIKEREFEDRLTAAEKRAEDAESKWEAREQETANQAQAEKVLATSVAAISDETPLTRAALTGKGAKAAGDRLLNITAALYQQTGEMPEPADVHKYFEEAERKFYEDRGLDPDLVIKTSKKLKKPNPEAGEKMSAPTLGNDLGTSTQPRVAPLTPTEERDDILKGMAANRT